jgi:aspartokinase
MTNIVHEVWKILDTSPDIRKNLSRGLINHSALARYIIEKNNINATLDAVISAIRRYKLDRFDELFDAANKMIGASSFSTKSNLANLSVIKDAEIQKILPKLFSLIHYNRGDVLRIIQADESIKILVDEKNLEKVTSLFPKDKILKKDKNLAEINMHLHPEAVNTPGLIAIASNELAMNGINIMETMSCVPELLWFVNEKDILKAHNVVYNLCKINQNNSKI